MSYKAKKVIGIIFAISVVVLVGYYLFKKNIGSVTIPPTGKIDMVTESEQVPYLKVPPGMQVNFFAKDLPGARTMLFHEGTTSDGQTTYDGLLVAQTSKGTIALIGDSNNDGVADMRKTILDNLNEPHGMSMSCEGGSCSFYVAEQDKLSVYDYDPETDTALNGKKLLDLPAAATDQHFTRSLVWLPPENPDAGPDTVLISVGSSCDACHDTGDHAKILYYNINTGEHGDYATGLRNATFMTLNPVNGKVFATEMGRDTLGDNIPPDEINIIEKGKNYGWPNCYGQNVHDDTYDHNTYIRNPCMAPYETPAFIDLQAHSAPLGLGFIPEEGWPESYWYNLLVAYHGSWNRSVPTGYKIERLKIDAKGNYSGREDFITGWLTADGKKLGRPADIKILSGGTMYISDDLAGVIYRVSPSK